MSHSPEQHGRITENPQTIRWFRDLGVMMRRALTDDAQGYRLNNALAATVCSYNPHWFIKPGRPQGERAKPAASTPPCKPNVPTPKPGSAAPLISGSLSTADNVGTCRPAADQ